MKDEGEREEGRSVGAVVTPFLDVSTTKGCGNTARECNDLGPSVSDLRRPVARWPVDTVCLVALLLESALLAGLTRGTWADVLVDFGRETYVPWQLSEGAALYRDLAYFNGPLSPYWNALLCSLFGANLTTIIVANAALLAAMLVLSYFCIRRVAATGCAMLSVSLFLWTCAGSQYLDVANYNWFCPYSHEMTHGLFLGMASVMAADRGRRLKSPSWVAAAGVLCGLTLLTKCEMGLAALAGNLVELAAVRRTNLSVHFRRQAALWTTSAVVPAVLAVAVLSSAMPLPQAISGVLGSWKYLLQSGVTSNQYYRAVMGTDDWLESLQIIYGWGIVYALVLAAGAWGGKREREEDRLIHSRLNVARSPSGGEHWTRPLCVLVTGGVLFWLGREQLAWPSMARPWPIILAAVAMISFIALTQKTLAPRHEDVHVLRLALCIFAGTLLLKIILYVRVMHYGFALAAPALLLVVSAGWEWWPRWIVQRGGTLWGPRAAFAVLAGAFLVSHLAVAGRYRDTHTVPVGNGPNQFRADRRGELVNRLLRDIEKHVGAGETLLCLPEGVMVNVLCGRRTSTRFMNFVPADMLMFGEAAMLSDLKDSPPDWIVLINRDTSEYGLPRFTRDYGARIGEWIDASYEPVVHYGGLPFSQTGPGYALLRRRGD